MRGSTVALMAAALLLLPSLLMLLLAPTAEDTYEQETRRMFVEWKAKHRKRSVYKYAGEEECRYALFKDSRRRVARANADGVTTSGLNGLATLTSEEFLLMFGSEIGEESYEEETRRLFVGWKAKHGKTYRGIGEEECRYMLFKGNRRVVVKLNAAGAAETVYGLNQFGDLTNEEVRERCDGRGGQMEGKLSTRCQDVAGTDRERLIRSLVCRCIALGLKQESGGSAIPGDEAHMWI